MTTIASTRGGAWLVEDVAPGAIFTVEKFSDEHRLIARTADDFMRHEVAPALERLEQKDWSLARTLVQRCGALGLIGTDVPEAYGGVEVDKVSSIIVGEAVGMVASFATTFGAQSGLSITPLLCFGTDDQKARYLPRLVTGELIGAYALSESGSGSDALGAKTRATRRADGSYLLTGEKMWISNGGFADLFIVFAKVDGEHFSAFLVERSFPGVSTGKEEHKMGLHGSSTTPLILQEAVVPAGQLLGEIGKGHKVAFNVLNYGRFKLAAMCSGGARAVIGEAARYAKDRRQFGQPIASFGAIRHKLAEMTVREFAVESMLYRTAGLIDGAVHGSRAPDAVLSALEEFAIEASALKVASSEMLDYVVDENVQIHGGNGFVRDYAAERHYRDARVNRIFEGTNEINRLLLPGLLVRRALKGGLPLIDAARALQDDLLKPSAPEPPGGLPLETELQTVGGMKKVAVTGDRRCHADTWRKAHRSSGDRLDHRRYRHRRLRRGERRAARCRDGRRGQPCGRTRLRQGRGEPRRRRRTHGTRGDGRRRHAARAPRRAPSTSCSDAGQYDCAAETDRRRRSRSSGISFLADRFHRKL